MSERYVVRPTEESDSPGLMELLADTPQQGSIQLNFERQPNYFWATWVGTSKPDLWVLEDTEQNRLAGAFSMGSREVFINGERQFMRFGSDLRVHRDYQGTRALLRLIKQAGKVIGDEYYQTVILKENDASMNTIGKGRLKVQPKYHPAGEHRTNMIELRQAEKHRMQTQVRRATAADIGQMQTFFDANACKKQFYPCYDFSRIGSNDDYYRDIRLEDFFLAFDGDELVGMTGLWDQKKFKQTRIAGYSPLFKAVRPFYNLYARIFGGLTLPAIGSLTSYTYLHATVVKENRPDILADLIAAVRKDLRNGPYDALVVGFDVRDPLHKATDKYKKEILYSCHFVAGYGDDPMDDFGRDKLMYLETARL